MSIDRKPEEKQLSKAVLDLKFMKKSKEKRQLLEDAEEREQLYEGHLNKLYEGPERIIMLNSYFECKKFLPCRLSFGGMDPDIEKLNEDRLTGLYKVVKKEESPPEGGTLTGMNADVDEEEMAVNYLSEAIRKKFAAKRKSEVDDYGAEEEGHVAKKTDFKKKSYKDLIPKAYERKLLTVDIEAKREGGDFKNRGRGDFRGRGRGDFRGRGRGDFRGRGRGDSRGRGRGDSRGRGRGDSRGRGRGDFRGRGRGDSRGRGRGDFRGRGRGDFKGRGRGDFQGRGRGDFQGRGRSDFRGREAGEYHGKRECEGYDDEGNQNGSSEMQSGDFNNWSYDNVDSSFDRKFEKSDSD